MPGAYPRDLIKNQKDQDRFWNLRLGAMFSYLPAVIVFLIISDLTRSNIYLSAAGGVLIWIAGMILTFRYNAAGRLMTRIMGPFDPNKN